MSIRSEIEKENEELRKKLGTGVPFESAAIVAALLAIYERLGDIETLLAEREEG